MRRTARVPRAGRELLRNNGGLTNPERKRSRKDIGFTGTVFSEQTGGKDWFLRGDGVRSRRPMGRLRESPGWQVATLLYWDFLRDTEVRAAKSRRRGASSQNLPVDQNETKSDGRTKRCPARTENIFPLKRPRKRKGRVKRAEKKE